MNAVSTDVIFHREQPHNSLMKCGFNQASTNTFDSFSHRTHLMSEPTLVRHWTEERRNQKRSSWAAAWVERQCACLLFQASFTTYWWDTCCWLFRFHDLQSLCIKTQGRSGMQYCLQGIRSSKELICFSCNCSCAVSSLRERQRRTRPTRLPAQRIKQKSPWDCPLFKEFESGFLFERSTVRFIFFFLKSTYNPCMNASRLHVSWQRKQLSKTSSVYIFHRGHVIDAYVSCDKPPPIRTILMSNDSSSSSHLLSWEGETV